MQHEVAVHEDDDIILAHTRSRHGPQYKCDGNALARLVLTNDAQRNIAIVADQLQMAGDLVFVFTLARTQPDRRRNARIPDFPDKRPDDGFGDFAVLAKRRHLNMDMARPPAGLPQRCSAVAHLRINDFLEDFRARPMVGPPQIAPDSENADDVDDFIVFAIPDLVGDNGQRNETHGKICEQLDLDQRRPLLARAAAVRTDRSDRFRSTTAARPSSHAYSATANFFWMAVSSELVDRCSKTTTTGSPDAVALIVSDFLWFVEFDVDLRRTVVRPAPAVPGLCR